MTFTEVSNEWMSIHKNAIGYSTYIGYENALRHIMKEIGSLEIADIKYSNLQKVINCKVHEGYGKRSLQGFKNTMSIVLDYAIKNEYVNKNVAKLVTIPKHIKQRSRDCLTIEEAKIILDFQHEYSEFVWLLYYTGLRRGEALALEWADIDFKNRFINIDKSIEFIKNKPIVKSTKTENGNRLIPIPEPLEMILTNMKLQSKSNYLFTQKTTGNMHTQTSYKKMWDRWHIDLIKYLAEKEYQLPIRRLTAHMLRHTYVTYLFEHEVPDLVIQNLAGHSDIAFTRRQYTHLRHNFMQENFQMVRDLF